MGDHARAAIQHPEAPPDRPRLALGDEAARRVRRRHLASSGGAAPSLAAAPDLHRQDRAGRREQPGHLLAGRQGRHPQARVLQPERPRRLRLFGRPQPHQPGHARIRRDVQGADQDAAPAADRDAGGQLHRHREYRRHPVPGHHPGALQRGGVADLQEQPQQRGLHRPHLRHQGAVLPARRPRSRRSTRSCWRAASWPRRPARRHARDAGAVLRAVAPEAARELDPVLEDARL